jgi:hypothetical protein
MRNIALAACIVAFAGCSSAPERPVSERYERQNSAKMPAEQAEAECYAILNSPVTPHQSLAQCMKGKGFAEK